MDAIKAFMVLSLLSFGLATELRHWYVQRENGDIDMCCFCTASSLRNREHIIPECDKRFGQMKFPGYNGPPICSCFSSRKYPSCPNNQVICDIEMKCPDNRVYKNCHVTNLLTDKVMKCNDTLNWEYDIDCQQTCTQSNQLKHGIALCELFGNRVVCNVTCEEGFQASRTRNLTCIEAKATVCHSAENDENDLLLKILIPIAVFLVAMLGIIAVWFWRKKPSPVDGRGLIGNGLHGFIGNGHIGNGHIGNGHIANGVIGLLLDSPIREPEEQEEEQDDRLDDGQSIGGFSNGQSIGGFSNGEPEEQDDRLNDGQSIGGFSNGQSIGGFSNGEPEEQEEEQDDRLDDGQDIGGFPDGQSIGGFSNGEPEEQEEEEQDDRLDDETVSLLYRREQSLGLPENPESLRFHEPSTENSEMDTLPKTIESESDLPFPVEEKGEHSPDILV